MPRNDIGGGEPLGKTHLSDQNGNKREANQGNLSRRKVGTPIRLPFKGSTLEEITDHLIKEGFNEADIGKELLKFAQSNDGLEKAIAFAAIIVKAKRARLKRG